MENREMFEEINALVGAVAKALDIGEAQVVSAIEEGRLGMEMLVDGEGRNYLAVTFDGRNVRLYPGAIFREGDQPDEIPGENKADEASEECGGGCSCGH